MTLWLITGLFSPLLEHYKSCVPWQKVAVHWAPAARGLEVEPPWGQTARLRYNCFSLLPLYGMQFPNLFWSCSHLCWGWWKSTDQISGCCFVILCGLNLNILTAFTFFSNLSAIKVRWQLCSRTHLIIFLILIA